VGGAISALAENALHTAAINAYMAVRYPNLEVLKTQNRNEGKKLSDRDWSDYLAGTEQGRAVHLNHAMGHQSGQFERIEA